MAIWRVRGFSGRLPSELNCTGSEVSGGLTEVDYELVEGQGLFYVERRSDEGVRERGAVGFGLVESRGANAFCRDFEIVDFVGEAVGGEGRGLVHQLEMEMGNERVAGVADESENL